nr:YitT family protein [Acidobacteriota bacterium]
MPEPPPFPVARALRDNPRSARRAFLVRFGRPLALARTALGVAAGAFLIAWSLNAFYVPTRLLAGGVTGIALLGRDLFGFPVGLSIALLNVPIFLLGFRDIGARFAALSGLGVVALSLFTDLLPVQPLTDDPLLASIFGGVVVGIGGGLALRAGGSTGGFDILGVVLNRRFGLGVSEVLLFLNGGLIVAKGLLGTPELAMYTLVAIWTSARAMDALMAARP